MEIPRQVLHALEMLEQKGFRAYIVGGAVRDMVVGKPQSDWDLATNADIAAMQDVFSSYRILPLGLDHGTITVAIEDTLLEISTFRGNAQNIHDDCAKRDFTIYAMAYTPKQGFIDYFAGEEDIARGVVRAVGSARDRFSEDPLRVLRALRFASQLSYTIAEETAQAMTSVSLTGVAVERITQEMTRMLLGDNIGQVLQSYGHICALGIPEIAPMIGFEQHNPYHWYDVWGHTAVVVAHTPPDPVVRWAALFHDMGKPATFSQSEDGIGHFYGHQRVSHEYAKAIMQRLKFSQDWQMRIAFLVQNHDITVPNTLKKVKKALYRMGKPMFEDLLSLFAADCAGQSERSIVRFQNVQRAKALLPKAVEENSLFTRKDLAINGHDLLALGFQGKDLGKMLEKLVWEVAVEGRDNTREALLAFVHENGI